jgi:hypothetical protein
MTDAKKMTYDPYKYDSFVDKETLLPILQAKYAKCVGKGAIYK